MVEKRHYVEIVRWHDYTRFHHSRRSEAYLSCCKYRIYFEVR